MKSSNNSWRRWPMLVVAGLGFASPLTHGVVENVEDSIYVVDGTVYYLSGDVGPTGASDLLMINRVSGTDRGWEPTLYRYTPPTDESPLLATMWMRNIKVIILTYNIEFSDADSKGGSSRIGTFQFYTRAAPTGAQNVSNRIRLHPGELNITGFVVQEERWVLIRGIGPSLTEFEVEDPVPEVTITLHHEDKVVASNAQWGLDGPDSTGMGWVFELAGAFPLEEGTKDSALFLLLDPGAYTVHADSPSATEPGDALVEVYILPYE